jgi:Protein of Unknown function (DUF2784)
VFASARDGIVAASAWFELRVLFMIGFYTTIVVVTVAVHFAFVAYGVLGGFLATRWPKSIWLHVPVVIWCVAIEIVDFVCPLTALERWARVGAGMPPLPADGFIDYYITGVWYPARYEYLVLSVVLLVVVTSWVLFALSVRRNRQRSLTASGRRGNAVPDVPHRTAVADRARRR